LKAVSIILCLGLQLGVHGQNRALDQYVFEMRDPKTDSARFRYSLKKIGEYLALDILDELEAEEKTVRTLTGVDATHLVIREIPVLVTILRAGLPLNEGIQKVFPQAQVGFLAMSRNEESLKAQVDYIALPELKGKSVVISDTMLATGGSLIKAIKIIEEREPKQIFIVTAIASKPGIERITAYNPKIKIFTGAIDPFLNKQGFILPGLGDAGDRAYGLKVQH
jgi:uracil phosphoribosyltransferase